MESVKIGSIVSLSLLLTASWPATSSPRADAADSGPIPPSITVSDAVGTNPGTVYTSGQAQRTVNVAWNAGSDYPYCEIYYTVNSANQTELGRGHDGAKPVTVNAGSTYALWMVVYLGPQGQDVRIVANLTVVAHQGNPPAPTPSTPTPSGGSGESIVAGEAAVRRSSALKEITTNLHPFIKNVEVSPGSMDVFISFNSSQKAPPIIEIGKVNPVLDRDGVLTFPFNSGAISRPVPGNNGAYKLHLSELNEQLDVATKYFYIIKVFGDDQTLRPSLRRDQYRGEFTTLGQTVKVVWEKVDVEDDSDDLSTGEVFFWFWANFGQPGEASSELELRSADSGHSYDINKTNVIQNAPNILVLDASGRDDDNTGTYLDIRDVYSPPPIAGPYSNKGWDMNVAKGEFNLSESSELEFSKPFWLNSMPDGNLKFQVYGHFEVSRATARPGKSAAQRRSDVTTPVLPAANPIKAIGRVRLGSNDFNGDGLGDILWHNASTGESQVWFLSGSSRIGRATISDGARPALIGPPWSIVGSNDFNADGKTDLLWHNSSTGETQIWQMNGHTFGGRATVLGENGTAALIGPPWSIVGTNDINGDKKSDIIWHNSSTGETQIWNMNGHKVIGRATVLGENGNAAFVGLPWRIAGSGDFNGDAKTDLLWHNGSTGETQIWHLDGHRLSGRATVLGENGSPVLVGLPWRITGTNDFDQDGAADILWHNGSTGEAQIWFMRGRSVTRRASVDADRDGGGARIGPPWTIMNH